MNSSNSPGGWARLFALCVLLASGAAGAADEPAASEPADNPPAVTESAPTPAAPAAGSADSPSDYEASEQISEDLSVSFPVDI